MWAVVEVQKVEDVTLTMQEFPSYLPVSRIKLSAFFPQINFDTIELLNFSCNGSVERFVILSEN